MRRGFEALKTFIVKIFQRQFFLKGMFRKVNFYSPVSNLFFRKGQPQLLLSFRHGQPHLIRGVRQGPGANRRRTEDVHPIPQLVPSFHPPPPSP